MASSRSIPIGVPAGVPIADLRFRASFRKWFWLSITISAVLHFLLFQLFPKLRIGEMDVISRELEVVPLPPEIEIPPPPELITRPAVPVVARREVSEEITIAPTTFEENPVENLPPPPEDRGELARQPVFTPYTVAPEIKDRAQAAEIVRRRYPETLKQAGIGGTVLLWAFVDEKGAIRNTKVFRGSGYAALDEAAAQALREVGEKVGFRPAMNMDRVVPVWIQIPLVFTVTK